MENIEHKKSQEFESKYFNIDEYYKNVASKEGWKKEDFVWALKVLESLPKEKLIEICKDPRIDIKFTVKDEYLDERTLVETLILDSDTEDLLFVLKKGDQK
jgi:hypothetical protein